MPGAPVTGVAGAALLLAVSAVAGAPDGGLAWRPAVPVDPTLLSSAVASLAERWVSADGLLALRPPRGWSLQDPGGPEGLAAPPGERGRFVGPGGQVLRVGFVDGAVGGQPEDLDKVMRNVAARMAPQGLEVRPSQPLALRVGAHPAAWSEAELWSPAGLDHTLVYAYVNHDAHPGVLVQAALPGALGGPERALLWASLLSLEVREGDAPKKGPPVWLLGPVVLAAGLLVAVGWLRRRRGGQGPGAFG